MRDLGEQRPRVSWLLLVPKLAANHVLLCCWGGGIVTSVTVCWPVYTEVEAVGLAQQDTINRSQRGKGGRGRAHAGNRGEGGL